MTTSLRLDPAHHAAPGIDEATPTAPRVTVLSVGYLVLDVVTTTHVVGRRAGGTAGNVAANLAWLGQRAGLLARIGNDHAGEVLRNDLSVAGVDITYVHHNADVETPILIQRLTEAGPQYLFACPVCNHKFASHRPATREQANEAAASSPKMLFVDRASKASLDLMVKVKSQGGLVMFEPNGPGRQNLTSEAISLADILKVSEDRVAALGELLHSTPRHQVQIRTLGARGLEFRIGEGSWHRRRARPAQVNDSAGAGDWVTAGLLAHFAEDAHLTYRNVSEGLNFGQALAALSCAFVGARGMNNCLTWNEAMQLLDGPATAPRLDSNEPHPSMPGHSKSPTHGCAACGSRGSKFSGARHKVRP